MSLQFGLAALAPFAPEHMNDMHEMIKFSMENVRIQLNIRKWFEQNEELK